MKKSTKTALSLLLVMLLLCTGCSGKSASAPAMNAGGSYARTETAAADYGYEAPAAEMAWGEPAEEEGYYSEKKTETTAISGTTLPANRKIIRNADMSLQTREYDAFIASLEGRIAAAGGYIQSSYVNGSSYSSRNRTRSANVTARIPAQNLDQFLNAVGEEANVLYKNIYTNDVTMTYVDSESRLNALRTERDTLMKLLENCEKMEDTITVYERITEVNYEIESYESRLRTYDDQIAYSTVNLDVQEVERETVVEKETKWHEMTRRLGENFEDLGDDIVDFFVGLVSALPYLILWGGIIAAVILLIRGSKKTRAKRREKKEKREAEKAARKAEQQANKAKWNDPLAPKKEASEEKPEA